MVKIFMEYNPYKLEESINKWLTDNPNYCICLLDYKPIVNNNKDEIKYTAIISYKEM